MKHTNKVRGNGQGSAYKSPNGKTWTAQAVVGYRASKKEGGQPVPIKRKKSGFLKKSDAIAYIPILLAGGITKSKVAPRLSEYWKLYSESAMLKIGKDKQYAYKAGTVQGHFIGYRALFTYFVRYIVCRAAQHIIGSALERFIVSPVNYRPFHMDLLSVFNFCQHSGGLVREHTLAEQQ